MTFQNKVNLGPARGWHGDFASTNQRVSVLGNQNGYQVGKDGVLAGSFVWVDADTQTVKNTGENVPDGFVARELTGVTSQYLQETSMVIPEGFMVTVYEYGEFLVLLSSEINSVKRGEIVHVSKQTGEIVADGGEDSIATKYKYVSNANGGDLVAISAWI